MSELNELGALSAASELREPNEVYSSSNTAIVVDAIHIDVGRMQLLVSIDDYAPLRTSPQIAQSILRAYPRIALHSCINTKGPTFSAVIEDTWLAHLLEHIIIDEQISIIQDIYAAKPNMCGATLVGITERIDSRTFKIEVSFIDDMVALQALNNALKIVDTAIRRLDE